MRALQALNIFVHAADSGSLSAAARALDLSPAVASAALKRLEQELQAPLFLRSTRSLRLTREGEAFLLHCRAALATLQAGQQEIASSRRQVRGLIQLSAPSDMGRNLLLGWLDRFRQQHPEVQFRLQLSDLVADVYRQPVDIALRYGEPPDSSLVALPLLPDNRRVLCAAPSYLARHPAPHSPQQLVDHACLCFMLGEDVHDRWRFQAPATAAGHAAGQALVVRVRSRQVANDGEVVHRWALSGQGIAYKSRLDVAADLASGQLVALCTDWLTEPTPLYLVMPDRRQLSPALRLLREHLQRCCTEAAAVTEAVAGAVAGAAQALSSSRR